MGIQCVHLIKINQHIKKETKKSALPVILLKSNRIEYLPRPQPSRYKHFLFEQTNFPS